MRQINFHERINKGSENTGQCLFYEYGADSKLAHCEQIKSVTTFGCYIFPQQHVPVTSAPFCGCIGLPKDCLVGCLVLGTSFDSGTILKPIVSVPIPIPIPEMGTIRFRYRFQGPWNRRFRTDSDSIADP